MNVRYGMVLLMGEVERPHRRMWFDTTPDSFTWWNFLHRVFQTFQGNKIHMNNNGTQWRVNSYKVISVCPVQNLLAVYAVPHPTESGTYILQTEPVHWLGVAKVTSSLFRQLPYESRARKIEESNDGNEVVGLELSEGMFGVCNDASNFAGLMMVGDDISTLRYSLPRADYPLAEDQFE